MADSKTHGMSPHLCEEVILSEEATEREREHSSHPTRSRRAYGRPIALMISSGSYEITGDEIRAVSSLHQAQRGGTQYKRLNAVHSWVRGC